MVNLFPNNIFVFSLEILLALANGCEKNFTFKVVELAWNIDSTVLAVCAEELPSKESSQEFFPKSYGKHWPSD